MTAFDDFWRIARYWRHPLPNPPKPAAIAHAKAIKEGAAPEEIELGAHGYTRAMRENGTEPEFMNTAAKFISEWRWMQYAPYEIEERDKDVSRAAATQEAKEKNARLEVYYEKKTQEKLDQLRIVK